jgi:hypothetical protein
LAAVVHALQVTQPAPVGQLVVVVHVATVVQPAPVGQ